jgi:hypothetical protein
LIASSAKKFNDDKVSSFSSGLGTKSQLFHTSSALSSNDRKTNWLHLVANVLSATVAEILFIWLFLDKHIFRQQHIALEAGPALEIS